MLLPQIAEPDPQGAQRDLVARGEFFLGQAERAAECLDARDAAGLCQLFRRHWPRVGVCARGLLDLFRGHRAHRGTGDRPLTAVGHHFDD
jgi:hypothetical protein